MFRRIFAWILLIGFVALIVNLLFFRVAWEISIALYIAAAVVFLVKMKK